MARLHRLFEATARAAVWISGFALLAVALLVSVDVIARKWFSVTLAGSDEISGYVLACASSWAYSYCLLRRAHIRIDVIYNLSNLRIRCLFDIVGLAVLLTFMALLTHRAVGVLRLSIERDSVSNTSLVTPLWIPQSFWVGGLVFFTATLVLVTVYTVLSWWRRDYRAVQRLAGIPSIAEELGKEPGESDARPAR